MVTSPARLVGNATLLAGALLLALPAGAFAQETARSSRLPLAARPVARPLLLPRGWFEWDTRLELQRHRGGFDDEGRRFRTDGPVPSTLRPSLGLRAGVSRSVELFWRGGMAVHHRDEDSWVGLLDPHFGARWQFVAQSDPETSAALEVAYEPAAGRESAVVASEPERAQRFSTTDGTPALSAALRLRTRIGGLRADAAVLALLRAPGRTALSGLGQSDRIDPGEGVGARLDLLYQLGPLALTGAAQALRTGADRLGDSLDERVGGGWQADVELGVDLSLTRGVEAYGGGRYRVRGPTSWAWYNEDLSVTWGPELWLGVLWRH